MSSFGIITQRGIEDSSKLVQIKNNKSFSQSVQKLYHSLTYDPKNAIVFGTYVYRAQPYPGDVDMAEVFTECCTTEQLGESIALKIKKIIKKFLSNKEYFFADFKAGIDNKYYIFIGKFDVYGLSGYDPIKIRLELNKQLKDKYLTRKEFQERIVLVKDKITFDEWEELDELLKKKYRIKWNPKEIMAGKKILPNNRCITLASVIPHNTNIRIDTFVPIDGKYIEASNFIVPQLVDNKGNSKYTNSNYEIDLPISLSDDIFKYAFSKKNFNPLKMAKRMWSFARITKNNNIVEKLIPLLRSDTAMIGQIISEMNAIIGMMENVPKLPIKKLLQQIDNIKARLGGILEFNISNEIYEIFDSILINYKPSKRLDFANKLKEIVGYFKKIRNEYSLSYLQNIGLYPPPKEFTIV